MYCIRNIRCSTNDTKILTYLHVAKCDKNKVFRVYFVDLGYKNTWLAIKNSNKIQFMITADQFFCDGLGVASGGLLNFLELLSKVDLFDRDFLFLASFKTDR